MYNKYRVQQSTINDDNYEVIKITSKYRHVEDEDAKEESTFQDRLLDCEAYIRLSEGGYM